MSNFLSAFCFLFLLLISSAPYGFCKKNAVPGDVIEEVDGKKLERLIRTEEYLAVYFYTKWCKDCIPALEALEQINNEASNFGVSVVRNSEKATAKKHGVTTFPTLVYFRNQQPATFDGDLKDGKKVLSWLTDLDSVELPDKIEEVNVKILDNLIEDSDFLAVLLYKDKSVECRKVILELENIDDEAHARGIGLVKISDDRLSKEYGIESFPALIYFRKKIPLLYDGDLYNEEELLNWLIEFQDLGEALEAIEDVSPNILAHLVEETPYLAVLFYDVENSRSQRILEELESIDDDCDRYGISFVKIDDDRIAAEYGIDTLPALVYFENKMPNFYQGDLTREGAVLDWLITQTRSDEIEDVTERVLHDMIKSHHELAVLFYDNEDEAHQAILTELENIDDDADKLGIPVVKIDNVTLAEAYGVKVLPTLVFFENQVPSYYKGNLTTEEAVLEWLKQLKESDKIEIVSDEVVELMIDKCDFLAVLFYNDKDPSMKAVIEELENIDDESDKAGIPLIRSHGQTIAEDYGISLPALVYFEDGVPNVYSGDLSNEDAVLKYLLDKQTRDEIEDVSSKALEQMIEKTEQLVVLFYNKNDKKSQEVLRELENIDEEADEEDLPFVRIHDEKLARDFGLDSLLPVLVYFEKQIPSVYYGDLTNEEQVWKWLHMQLTSDGIEEVTEKILYNLISHNPFLAVVFYDQKSKKSAKVLKEIETIDETADQYDILIVKNFNAEVAQKYGIQKLPALIFFKSGTPVIYQGNLMKEEEVLDFLLAQLVNDEIEDINENILDQLVETTESVAVFFYDKDASISAEILKELEQIDSHTEKVGIPFVRIDDDAVAKEFGVLDELPILVYFENKIPSVYEGDLMKEEEVLAWILKNKEEDTIEEVTDEILGTMLKEHEYVLVFFAPNDCKECDKILHELENIDDDTDHHGIMFVTTDDMTIAKKEVQIDKFPALVLFRNGIPMAYKGQKNLVTVLQDGKYAAEIQGITKQKYSQKAGDMLDEDVLLKFVTSEEALDIPDRIDDVNTRMLDHILNTSDYVAVLFYKEGHAESDKVLADLEDIDDDAEAKDIDVVKISDADTIEEYNIVKFPTLVFFKKRLPLYYEGDLMNEQKVLKWLVENKQKKDDAIEYVDKNILEVLMNDVDHIVVYFYGKVCAECKNIMQELEKIDETVDKLHMHFVKTDDVKEAESYGVTEFPTLVYFEHSVPSIYSGDLMNSQEVLEWLTKQKKEDTIENVNREMLFMLIEEQEFLAVFFYAENDKESEEVMHNLEKIDDDTSVFDIHLVQMSDKIIAKKHGIQNLPGLVLFRNGKPVKFEGNLKNEKEVLEWLTSPATMAVTDVIEKVNMAMLERVLERFDYVTVFLYKKVGCKLCAKVLDELEKIDHEAQAEDIHIVKIDDKGFAKKYGIYSFPAILFFQGPKSKPVVYAGDMKNGERMLSWLMSQKDPSYDIIEEVEGKDLLTLIDLSDHLAVFFYDKKMCSNCDAQNIESPECEDCQIIMDELESVDDDAYRSGIQFVKTPDLALAKKHGAKSIPALVYYEDRVPFVYDGDLDDDEEVLQWLLHQKTDDTIEKVNGAMLDSLIKKNEYLAVFISKPHCHACELALTELENIDDDTEKFGIEVVRISDLQVSKKYGIKAFPALIYFRNGNPLIYDGDLKDEHAVLEWLIDDDNRELRNEIESVGLKMLTKLVEESPILAVYFYNDSRESERILMELEKIDDECDQFGIDLVKVSDPEALKVFHVKKVPALAFFRKQKALFYDGDLEDEETLLKWLTSNDVFEIKDEIEEVNREMVEKLLEDNELVTVLFYADNCIKSKAVLAELEHIDDDADKLDIMFVKIMDPGYAKKFGITRVPALVYFKKKIPTIYQGNLLNEEAVLEWLRKDTHHHSGGNSAMFAVIGVGVAFVVACLYCQRKTKTD